MNTPNHFGVVALLLICGQMAVKDWTDPMVHFLFFALPTMFLSLWYFAFVINSRPSPKDDRRRRRESDSVAVGSSGNG